MHKLICSLAVGAAALAGPLAAQEMPEALKIKVDFQKNVLPILEEHCIKCHNADVQKSGLRMDTRDFILQGGTEGPSVIIGNSAESMLTKLVAGVHPDFEQMPPKNGPLTDDQIGMLRAWIDQGLEWPEDVIASQYPTVAKAVGLPEDWRVEATAQDGPLASWALSADIKGPAGEPAIAVTHPEKAGEKSFNLLWTPNARFKDGSMEVKTKVIGGTEQGGGVVWRVQDKNNYYVARYSPVEKKLGFYKVVEGVETEIASAPFETADEWVTIKIEQQGNKLNGYINDQKLIDATDDTFTEAGGAGYWTKADASTAFAGAKLNPAQ